MDARRVSAVCLLLAIATTATDARAAACRVEECRNFRAIRYHQELGCVSSADSSECCPARFDCSSLQNADKTKCHYKGKTYDIGSNNGADLEYKCIPGCECIGDTDGTQGGEAAFSCPGTDCALVGIPQGREDECYWTAAQDACCPTGVRCVNDTDSPQNLAECPYKGKTYREDQEMDVAHSQCKRCICQRGFDGTLDGPWCKRHSCEYTLYHRVSELKRCAPIFRDNDNCCASRFHCPSPDDNVVRHSESTAENDGDQCSFGDHRLNVGDELLVGSDGCVKCQCDVPPFITCTLRSSPECEAAIFG